MVEQATQQSSSRSQKFSVEISLKNVYLNRLFISGAYNWQTILHSNQLNTGVNIAYSRSLIKILWLRE